MATPTKVLIIDDSALIRGLLSEILSADSSVEVVGTAADPYIARDKIKQLKPDVLTLDVEMPNMDGITFLKNIMRLHPMPVVMISTLTQKGAQVTLECLEQGAVDFVGKPTVSLQETMNQLADEIRFKVKTAAKANIKPLESRSSSATLARQRPQTTGKLSDSVGLIVIGASTGGTEATKRVLQDFPAQMPPIVIVQHMPPGFTGSYADRLDKTCELKVMEVKADVNGLETGHAYLANGSQHLMVVKKASGKLCLRCSDEPAVNRHKPSVDFTFQSAAEALPGRVTAVLLTGMGLDGAAGMMAVKKAGGETIAQDEASSVVWGMPRVAYENGATTQLMPLNDIGSFIVKKSYGA